MPESSAENRLLSVGPSPHVRRRDDTRTVMLSVCAALLPAAAAGLFFFGWNALRVMAVCVTACLAFEWLFLKLFKNDGSLSDGSALVTGLLLAFNLPPAAPWWIAVTGALAAMLLGKHIYGGLGHNPFNPALAARVFLLIAWPVEMIRWTLPRSIDAVSGATVSSNTVICAVNGAVSEFMEKIKKVP